MPITIQGAGITVTGSLKLQRSPDQYSVGSFNGTTDYLSVPANTAFLFTGDFTIEGWMYFTNVAKATPQSLIGIKSSPNWFDVRWFTNRWQVSLNSTSGTNIGATPAPVNNTWAHVSCVRSGTSINVYVNGISTGTTLTSSATLGYNTSVLGIGADAGSPSNLFVGYISNLRIVNGTALYTTNFTPSGPLAAITNTVLLTCQSNIFVDNSTNNFTITRAGTPPNISTLNPFPVTGYSVSFNGSTGVISTAASSLFAVGTGDFTIEFWVYATASTRQDWLNIMNTANNYRITVYYTATQIVYLAGTTSAGSNRISYTLAGASLINTWYHVALSRVSGSSKLFVNGTQVGTTFADTLNFSDTSMRFFAGRDPAGSTFMTGYLSNIRVAMGVGAGLYSANFVPSSIPLTTTSQGATASTVEVLTCQSATIVDNSTNAFTITAAGATVITTVPFPNPYTGYNNSVQFNGTTQYLSIADNTAFDFGAGNFTVEAWVYQLASKNVTVVGQWASGAGFNTSFIFRVEATGKLGFAYNNGTETNATASTSAISYNTWAHVAWTKTGTTLRYYINGVLDATTNTVSGTLFNSTASVLIGLYNTAVDSYFNGYISNLRLVKGDALYTSTFTPSYIPLRNIPNTSLLTCQNYYAGQFIDNSTNNSIITAVATPTISTTNPFP